MNVQPKYRAFHSAKDGEWIQPKMRGYLMSCCDCGLVHKMNFRLAADKDGKNPCVQFQAFRHKTWTCMMRMMRAKRSGGNCVCGAIVKSRKRRQVSRKGAKHG